MARKTDNPTDQFFDAFEDLPYRDAMTVGSLLASVIANRDDPKSDLDGAALTQALADSAEANREAGDEDEEGEE